MQGNYKVLKNKTLLETEGFCNKLGAITYIFTDTSIATSVQVLSKCNTAHAL